MCAGEVPVPACEAMQADEQLGGRMLEILLRGVSTRQYKAVLLDMASTVGGAFQRQPRSERGQRARAAPAKKFFETGMYTLDSRDSEKRNRAKEVLAEAARVSGMLTTAALQHPLRQIEEHPFTQFLVAIWHWPVKEVSPAAVSGA